ncbi:DUF4235 domain-containing protein [Gordonia sp. DT30]|uniref:DUF4235 domain-containing protein n=1 Tax=unclassified Gordonia (in: high G+C Gram-positive bacteria) TaxID=2657482 RepID=UPI003CEDABA3
MSATSKIIYKPLSMGTSVLGGVVAGAVFNQIWKRISDKSGPPDAENLERSTGEVIAAAALQGLVFGVVKAAIDRAGAQGYAKVTHTPPAA